jgi:hypothetical protein
VLANFVSEAVSPEDEACSRRLEWFFTKQNTNVFLLLSQVTDQPEQLAERGVARDYKNLFRRVQICEHDLCNVMPGSVVGKSFHRRPLQPGIDARRVEQLKLRRAVCPDEVLAPRMHRLRATSKRVTADSLRLRDAGSQFVARQRVVSA